LLDALLVTPAALRRLNAARSRHREDWLLVLPITSCGLKLDDEAVRVAVEIRLALKLVFLTSARAVCRRRRAADILLTQPPPIVTDRRAADMWSASRRRSFRDVFASCCAPTICC